MSPPRVVTAESSRPAALSRELSEFLIDLSIGLTKHAMYPDGHPSLGPAAMAVTQRAALLLDERPTLSLGVARHQLVIEGVATEPGHPLLGELAGRLHRHHIGAVTFSRGLQVEEVSSMLKVLAVEADRTGQPLGLGPRERLTQWAHIKLHSLSYERLELMDEIVPTAESLRGVQLWVGMARAALAQDEAVSETGAEPSLIARALDNQPRNEAYDQVIVGYLLQIAQDLRHSGGADRLALRRRMSHLVRAMKPETLRRLVAMGGNVEQRRKFVLDAAHGMAVDAVVDIVRAAADASQQVISLGLVRMLAKLASHAEFGAEQIRPHADAALRDQVTQLLSGWKLQDPNPGNYLVALQGITAEAQTSEPRDSLERDHSAEPRRLVETALEVGSSGAMVARAVDRALALGQLGTILEVLEQAPDGGGTVGATLWQRLAAPATVQAIVSLDPPDFAALDRLLPRLGTAALEPLLDALAESSSRTTRRGLLDRASRIAVDIGPAVVRRLQDPRWYVQRNMLVVLESLPRLPPDFPLEQFLAHRDARVRREAVKLQLKMAKAADDVGGKGTGAGREAALRAGLKDQDPRTLRIALTALQEDCPDGLVPQVIETLRAAATPSNLRVLAIRALGRARIRPALDALLKVTSGGRSLFGKPRLPPKSPELLAALTALAAGWSADRRALEVLARAALSEDADVRNATDP